MRKFIIPLLMAGVLMPAAAQAEPGDRWRHERGERAERSDNSSNDRAQRVQRTERSSNDSPRVQIERAERPQRVERSVETRQVDQARARRFERRQEVTQPARQVEQAEQVERVRRTDRANDGILGGFQREATRQQQLETQVTRDRVSSRESSNGIIRNGVWEDNHRRWSGDWRKNSRYDWRSYRNRYGSLFRLGRYYDPYGWSYRRFSIGFDLWPSYYGSNFWLNDPWQYRLPQAYGPYRWVRYYDDALLVNIYTGQVVDVVYNVFW